MAYKVLGRKQVLDGKYYDPFEANNLIVNYPSYQLRYAEIPYDYVFEHYILRKKDDIFTGDILIEEKEIKNERIKKGFTIIENSNQDKSVPTIYHIHIIKFISYDEIDGR